MEKNYCGITIGPIVKTINQAQKTRELWSGSYLFSYLMKQLLIQLKIEEGKLILPYAGLLKLEDQTIDLLKSKELKAGIFPDRAVFELSTGQDIHYVQQKSEDAQRTLIKKLVDHLKQHGKLNERNEEDARKYFKAYFQVYAVSREFKGSEPKAEIVKSLFETLDVLELQTKVVPEEKQPFIQQFLTTSSFSTKHKRSFLKEDAGLEAERFESIIEIAAKELIKEEEQTSFYNAMKAADAEDADENLISWLKDKDKNDGLFRTYHKYIAIVNIDGDNFGDYIKQLSSEAYDQFTAALARFSLAARQAIEDYGGQPVYLGGDDALFFAPVRRDKDRNIFTLLDEIDRVFRKAMKAINTPECIELPTLSAGVSIYYYKHPLSESLKKSAELLFDIAKKFRMRNGKKKNAIAVSVQKHSGQSFGLVFRKEADQYPAYELFKQMLTANIQDGIFLNSVVQHMARHQALLAAMGHDKDRVAHFITNHFNESIHKQAPFNTFLDSLKAFVPRVYDEYPIKDPLASDDKEADQPEPIERDMRAEALYGALRLVKFLNRDDNE